MSYYSTPTWPPRTGDPLPYPPTTAPASPPTHAPLPNIFEQLGADPVSKLAAAIDRLAAAIERQSNA